MQRPDLTRAPFRPRLLLVEMQKEHPALRRELLAMDPRLIIVRIEPNQAGIITDYTDEGEIIRFGYPAQSRHEYFQIMAPRRHRYTAFGTVFERIIYSRHVTDIICPEERTVYPVAHAMWVGDTVLWCGATPYVPADLATHRDLTPRIDLSSREEHEALLAALAMRMQIGEPVA